MKDFENEVSNIIELIRTYNPQAKTILALGCENENYSSTLAKLGYKMCSLDQKKELNENSKRKQEGPGIDLEVSYILDHQSSNKFDVIVSTHNFANNNLTDANISKIMEFAYKLLNTQGIFVLKVESDHDSRALPELGKKIGFFPSYKKTYLEKSTTNLDAQNFFYVLKKKPASNTSVILPTFDEALNIEEMILRVRKVIGAENEILVVDDNSPDGTGDIVRNLMKSDPMLFLLLRTESPGLAASTQEGIEYSSGKNIVWMDCDLSQPPEKIPDLLRKIIDEGNDIAVASRYVKGGKDVRGESRSPLIFFQVFLSLSLKAIITVALKKRFLDWSSGFIAVRASVASNLIPLKGHYGEYFMYMICQAFSLKKKIVEVPYTMTPRERGESKTATSFFGMFSRGIHYLAMIHECRKILRSPPKEVKEELVEKTS